MANILITGIAGGLSQRVAAKLLFSGHSVVGVDYREVRSPLPPSLDKLKVVRAHYNKTIIEDIFRHQRFDAVMHLGRAFSLKDSVGKRFDLNVVGSQKLMNLVLQHKVASMVVLSTFHIYGAHPSNHIPIAEDEPLRAGLQFPQIADAIQMDNMATTWVYRHPAVKTCVLRATNIVGPTLHNTLTQFLRLRHVPYLLGFNPMMQFLHEDDLADAIITSWQSGLTGVHNVATDEIVPWRTAIALTRARTFPIPAPVADVFLRATGNFPGYLIDFFRYPCVITDRSLRQQIPWTPRHSLEATLWSAVATTRMNQA
ncbi:MAG: NAD-dependent epimerase/dehydratase family protein [Deltaproteobacteria bacterium]|nr:NAD-dependent epimerase/dehydratase family protein [Deltaproteobacteria bacterium]MBP8196711.1 NAD-dependent epimerase/dehydratase family protein [Deltaproteobacteria bacterium]